MRGLPNLASRGPAGPGSQPCPSFHTSQRCVGVAGCIIPDPPASIRPAPLLVAVIIYTSRRFTSAWE